MELKVSSPSDNVIIPPVPKPIQYWQDDWQTQEVHADEVGPKYITYKCPMCARYHYHGSEGRMHNRIEIRGCHCKFRRTQKIKEVRLIIDDNTYRTCIW